MSFSRKAPDAKELFGFDFEDMITGGITITAAACDISVIIGDDPDVGYMLPSNPHIDGYLVSVLVQGGVTNTKYCLTCIATTSEDPPQEVKLSGEFWVRNFCSIIALVSLDQARDHLRVIHNDDDEDIFSKIEQASAIILDYLKLDAVPTGWGNLSGESPSGTGVPHLVQAATLLVLGELHNKREASGADVISPAVVSILNRYRDPAMA